MFTMAHEKNVFFGGFVFLDEVILCISVPSTQRIIAQYQQKALPLKK